MDTEAFIRWALDDTRTVEERLTVELLVETGLMWWESRHPEDGQKSFQERMEIKRQRALNPAYDPRCSEHDLRRACEMFPEIKAWQCCPYGDRIVRDLTPLRFFTNMTSVSITCAASDLTPLAQMASLTALTLTISECMDLSPIARCRNLRELHLSFTTPWPDLTGLEELEHLESLSLTGNLLAIPTGGKWTRVRHATLVCQPLAARSVADLPFLPNCEFLTLGGVDRLDGIERYPKLRNLTLSGLLRDLSPLEHLSNLTWLRYTGDRPRDVSPLTRLPKLHYAQFDATPAFFHPEKPRDYSVLANAPALRELHVTGCPPVEMEVAAINSGLPPCDDLWLLETPRPLEPLQLIIAKMEQHPQRAEPYLAPDETAGADIGIRQCEAEWARRYVARSIRETLEQPDWGAITARWEARSFIVNITSFDVVERLPEIIFAIRKAVATLRYSYAVMLMISLEAPRRQATPAQLEMERRFNEERERLEFERMQKERAEYLEKLHLLELAKQEGDEVDPDEFAPADREPPIAPPWEASEDAEDDDEDDDDDGPDGGGVRTKEKKLPEPPPGWADYEHPLADNYRLICTVTPNEVYVPPHHRQLAVYLMRREPDLELSTDEEE